MAPLPEIPQLPRTGKGHGSRAEPEKVFLHPRHSLPLGLLGRPKDKTGAIDHTPLLRLKYNNAFADLGNANQIRTDFTTFQEFLYQSAATT